MPRPKPVVVDGKTQYSCRCNHCKTMFHREYANAYEASQTATKCDKCGWWLSTSVQIPVKRVAFLIMREVLWTDKGEHATKCGSKCRNACGPNCDCVCRGLNHGRD
jgi:hypothetical protein